MSKQNNVVTGFFWHVDASAKHLTIDLPDITSQTNYTSAGDIGFNGMISDKTL